MKHSKWVIRGQQTFGFNGKPQSNIPWNNWKYLRDKKEQYK
jgi:hypothetical protein